MNLWSLKKTNMNLINKYGIILRLVQEDDAEFILSLRTNNALNKYISATSDNIEDQINWIRDYKTREQSGHEFYYITEDKQGNRYGTIRLYNFDEHSFEIGSWVFLTNSPIGMAVKAQFIGFETGFDYLKSEFCRLEIRKKNKSVVNYIKDFNATIISEDELNYYFILTKENFLIRRKNLSYLLKDTK